MQPHVVHALGRTVQPGDDVPGHGGAQKAAGVHAVPGLAGAIHGDQRHAHPGKGGLLGKGAGRTGVAVELQHQRHGLIAVRPQIFGVDTRTCHAGKPQVQKVAAVPAGHLFGLGDGIVQRHRVCLGHARLPERLKVRGLRRGPIVAAQRLDFTCSHLCTFFFTLLRSILSVLARRCKS